MTLETAPIDQALAARARQAISTRFLADAVSGPTLVRPLSVLAFECPAQRRSVSAAHGLTLRSMPFVTRQTTTAYKAGVAAFQRAVIEDPPAIFLPGASVRVRSAHGSKCRSNPGAISSATLRLWRPLAAPQADGDN